MFLWASQVLDMVDEENSLEGIQMALGSLPQGLDDVYLRIVTKMSNMSLSQIHLARNIIYWTVSVQKPLTVLELAGALESQFGSIADFGLTIKHLCGGLIVVGEQGQIRFLHMTVRDIFCNGRYTTEIGGFCIALPDAHLQLTRRSLECLSPIRGLQVQYESNKVEVFMRHPLSAYAASY